MAGPELRQAKIGGDSGLSRIKERHGRRREGRQFRVHDARWVDPYPWVMGTYPEKLVFAWLATRHIPFTFQADLPDYTETLEVENFRPDFYLPQLKVIIEVQGMYWHSLPEQAEHDVYKFAVYKAMGLEVYWFWEDDILTDLGTLMAGVKELRGYTAQGPWVWEQQKDDLAGLRSTNAARRRPLAPALGTRGVQRVRPSARKPAQGF